MSKIENHTPVKIPIFYDKELLDDVRLETINPLAKEVTKLSSKMSEACSSINSVDTKMVNLEAKVDAEIGKNRVDLTPILQDIETHREGLIYLKNATDVLEQDLQDLEAKVDNSDISLLSPRVTKNEADIALLQTESDDLADRIDEVDAKIPAVDHVIADLAIMKDQYADMDTTVKNTHINIANLAQDVGRFDGGLDSLIIQCNDTEGRVNKAVNDINNLVSNVGRDIAGVNTRLDALESDTTDSKVVISGLSTDVGDLKRGVSIVTDKVANMDIIVGNNHSNLIEVTKRVIDLEANVGSGGGGGGSVDLTPVTDRLDDLEKEVEDVKDRVEALENKEITKFYVLPILGQSNGVGYGEIPASLDDRHPRVKQLGRFGGSKNGASTTLNVNLATTLYGDLWDELRPYDDCNLKVIPATPCLDHVENQFYRTNKPGGTVGFGLYLGKLLLKYIPDDYGILLVPCCRGGSAFTKGATGTYDAVKKQASNDACRWGVGQPLSRSGYDRVKAALDLNPENKLLPVIWVQGEFDAGNPEGHLAGFEEYYNWYKAQLIADGFVSRIPGNSIEEFRWFCLGSTKWLLGLNTEKSYSNDPLNFDAGHERMSVYDNYIFLSRKHINPSGSKSIVYVRADVMPNGDFVETNRERGDGTTTATRQIHFSTYANVVQLPKLILNALLNHASFTSEQGSYYTLKHVGGCSMSSTDGVVSDYYIPSVDFNLTQNLLVHQKWPTVTQTDKLKNYVTGGPTLTGGSASSVIADANFGGVLRFTDVSNSHINIPLSKGRTSFTKSIVFKPDVASRSGENNILSASSVDTDGIIWFRKGCIVAYPDYTSTQRPNQLVASPALYQDAWNGQFSDWQHLVVTYNVNSNMFSLYLNGAFLGDVKSTTATLNNLILGLYKTTTLRYKGLVANYRIYDRCLSHGEVGTLWHCDMKNYL